MNVGLFILCTAPSHSGLWKYGQQSPSHSQMLLCFFCGMELFQKISRYCLLIVEQPLPKCSFSIVDWLRVSGSRRWFAFQEASASPYASAREISSQLFCDGRRRVFPEDKEVCVGGGCMLGSVGTLKDTMEDRVCAFRKAIGLWWWLFTFFPFSSLSPFSSSSLPSPVFPVGRLYM